MQSHKILKHTFSFNRLTFCRWSFISDRALAFSLATWTAMSRLAFINSLTAKRLYFLGIFVPKMVLVLLSCLWSSTSSSALKFFWFPLKVFFSVVLMSVWVTPQNFDTPNADFLTPTVNRLGMIVSSCKTIPWTQIDEEARRSAYESLKFPKYN